MMPPKESRNVRDFSRVVTWSAALSMAIAVGFLASIRQVNPTVEFRFSWITILSFFAAGGVTAFVFRLLFRGDEGASVQGPRSQAGAWKLLIFFCVASGAVLLASVGVALKNVSHEGKVAFITGAGFAVLVVGAIAWVSWKILRFLEAEDKKELEREQGR